MNFKDNLKRIRKENNLSQEDLAEKLNVSRQSVSKWESGLAYPEMDKVLQLCKLFNLNIDELLNQNIKKEEKDKKSKINVNKYIDDFVNFITKIFDMFSSMKFKDKIKCLFEQIFIIGIFALAFFIIGEILMQIANNFFNILPDKIYNLIYQIFSSIYLIISISFTVIITLHLFKTRYLDYYEIVDKSELEDNNVDKKIIEIDNKKEKIIIRDPKHSSFKFINGLLKILLFIFKFFIILISIFLCLSFISLISLLILSFLITKTGILFIGILLCIISLIIINYIFLNISYKFVFNRKCNTKLIGIYFIISLILCGIGIGLSIMGIKDFKVVDIENSYLFQKENIEIDMNKELVFEDPYYINYIESDNKNIKIEVMHTLNTDLRLNREDNYIYFSNEFNEDYFKEFNYIIKDINNKKIFNGNGFKINIYTNKDNIKILKDNLNKYRKIEEEKYKEEYENDKDREIEELLREISRLNSIIDEEY